MKRQVLATLALGAVLAAFCVSLAKTISQSFRRTAERSYEVAYFRYRCAWGRWPRTTGELFSSAKPDYLRSIRQEGDTYSITVRETLAPNDRVILTFSGSYLGSFEDSLAFDFSGYDCKKYNDPSYYFRLPEHT